jgi:hypothetical protein
MEQQMEQQASTGKLLTVYHHSTKGQYTQTCPPHCKLVAIWFFGTPGPDDVATLLNVIGQQWGGQAMSQSNNEALRLCAPHEL